MADAQFLGAVLAASLAAGAASAVPMRYELSQGGYPEGATLTGVFVGEDVDGDGLIVGGSDVFPPEVTAIELAFSGTSEVPAFEIAGVPSESTLAYVLGSGALGNSLIPGSDSFDGLLVREERPDGFAEVGIGLGTQSCADPLGCYVTFGAQVGDAFEQGVAYADEFAAITVAPIPLAPAGAMLGGALGLLWFRRPRPAEKAGIAGA